MALGTPVPGDNSIKGDHVAKIIRPVSLGSAWISCIDNGGLETADNGGSDITNPDTQITNATTHMIQDIDYGTIIRFRMKYDDGIAVLTHPVIQVFGRAGSSDAWMPLVNNAGAKDVTLTLVAATDVTDGTDCYTTPDQSTHAFDLDGCQDVLVAVKTAFVALSGDATLSELQFKVI